MPLGIFDSPMNSLEQLDQNIEAYIGKFHKKRLIRAGRWPYGGWEREFSLRELSRLLQDTGFKVLDAYGRGYFPRPLAMLRNLGHIEKTA